MDYGSHINRIGLNQCDFAYLGPVGYVNMVNKYGPKPILGCIETNGNTVLKGYIFTLTTNTIDKISDLKGKSFAFGESNSTMSNIIF